MSLQYSGSTIINRTFTPATRVDHINSVTQALFDAGWSTISGTPGNVGVGGTVLQESAAGNQGQKVRVASFDPGSGTCPQYFIRHVSNSPQSQAMFANPTGTWRIVANKFHFFTFVSGSASRTTARTFVCAGLLYAPSFLVFSAGDCLGFMMGNAQSDADATPHCSWRDQLRTYDNASSGGRFSGIVYAGLQDMTNYSSNDGAPMIGIWQGGYHASGTTGFRWNDGTLPAYEPLVGWAPTGLGGEGKFQGQMYDALVLNDAWNSESTITYDGHTWIALTDQSTQLVSGRVTLFLAVT